MLMRTEPFGALDRLSSDALTAVGRPPFMSLDAWREGDVVYAEFDLPGVEPADVDVTVDCNVLTVRAERPLEDLGGPVAAERVRGVFSRQVILGDGLAVEAAEAAYRDGVLQVRIPLAAQARPRKIEITVGDHPGSAGQGAGRAVFDGRLALPDLKKAVYQVRNKIVRAVTARLGVRSG